MQDMDYRLLLREELVARCKRNPAYSARAMARDLKLSPPFLSQILSGQRVLAEDRAQSIANRLAWPRWKKTVFVHLVRHKQAREPQLRENILNEVKTVMKRQAARATRPKFDAILLEEFSLVAGWQHSAIYQLTDLQDFRDDPEWIARKLGLSALEAAESVNRLVRLQLLERKNGVLCKKRGNPRVGATPSQAIRQFHKQHLEKAATAIEMQRPEQRDFSGTTLSIDPKKLPRAKALIRRFQSDLMQFLEGGEKTAIYHLAVQLYRLDLGD